MSRDPRRQPKKAKPVGADTARGWWYEDDHGIDVLASTYDGKITSVRIGWAALLRAAQRSSGREVIVKLKARGTR